MNDHLWRITWGILGGDRERIIVRYLHDDVDEFARKIGPIDSAKARCTYEMDREFLLAIIEASFGTVAPFDKVVSEIFATELRRAQLSPAATVGSAVVPHKIHVLKIE